MRTIIKALLALALIGFLPGGVEGQQGKPPPQPPGHGSPGNQDPNETPAGSGLGILTLLCLASAAKKGLGIRKVQKK